MPGPDLEPPKFFEDVSKILNQIIKQSGEKQGNETKNEN